MGGLSGATWTLLTPPARTSCPPRGSPTTPGPTRPAPPLLWAPLSVPVLLPQWSQWPQWLQLSQLSQSTLLSILLSTPPTPFPSHTLTLWLPLLSEARDPPSRKYLEPMEDMIRSLSESPDTEMPQARLTSPD